MISVWATVGCIKFILELEYLIVRQFGQFARQSQWHGFGLLRLICRLLQVSIDSHFVIWYTLQQQIVLSWLVRFQFVLLVLHLPIGLRVLFRHLLFVSC